MAAHTPPIVTSPTIVTPMSFSTLTPEIALMIAGNDGKPLVTINRKTNTITLGEGVEPDQAARAMLKLVERYMQQDCPQPKD